VHLEEALEAAAVYATGESFNTFAQHLDRAWVEEALLSTGTATIRTRRLPSEQVVWLVLGMALLRDLPICDVVDRLELALPTPEGRTVAGSAIPAARRRIGAAPLEWLFVRTASEWGARSSARERWRGLSLWAIDGTTLRLPDSPESRAHFGGQSVGQAGRGESGYPSLRLVVLMTLRSHLITAANFGPYAVDERNYADALWDGVPDKALVILDRAYLQANVMVRSDAERDRHWLMRAKSNSAWRVVSHLGKGDALVEMDVTDHARRQDASLPKTLTVRAIEYRFGKEKRYLLTSLLNPTAYPVAEIVSLYRERWEIELGYGELKTEMLERAETIRSKSPESVTQELWGILIAYNLVRVEIERIADELNVSPLRISFIEALRFMREQWLWAAMTRTPGAIPGRLRTMKDRMRRFLLPPRRPDRSYPRAVKLKMSNYARKRPSTGGR
jgi:hypothetical protein